MATMQNQPFRFTLMRNIVGYGIDQRYKINYC